MIFYNNKWEHISLIDYNILYCFASDELEDLKELRSDVMKQDDRLNELVAQIWSDLKSSTVSIV